MVHYLYAPFRPEIEQEAGKILPQVINILDENGSLWPESIIASLRLIDGGAMVINDDFIYMLISMLDADESHPSIHPSMPATGKLTGKRKGARKKSDGNSRA